MSLKSRQPSNEEKVFPEFDRIVIFALFICYCVLSPPSLSLSLSYVIGLAGSTLSYYSADLTLSSTDAGARGGLWGSLATSLGHLIRKYLKTDQWTRQPRQCNANVRVETA